MVHIPYSLPKSEKNLTTNLSISSLLVLKTVLQHRQHCLDGASLTVKVAVPAAEQTDQEDMEESRTIELNGLRKQPKILSETFLKTLGDPAAEI